MEFSVMLTSVADVKAFVDAAAGYPYRVNVLAGYCEFNGKSFMGLCSVDLPGPVMVRLEEDGTEAGDLKRAPAAYVC